MYRYFSETGLVTPSIVNSLKIFVRDFKDVPTVSVQRLNSEEVSQALDIHSLTWDQLSNSTKLVKQFKFTDFKQTFAFMGSVSQIADQMQHFPKWTQKGNSVVVEMTTPDCKGVTMKDVLLAYTMENIATEVSKTTIDTVCDKTKFSTSQLLNNWNSNYSKTEELLQGLQKATAQL